MNESIWLSILVPICAYLVGSLSPAVWIACHFGGMDLRSLGSGNPGSTNVLRNMGWVPGVVTFIADFLKGYVITWLCAAYISRELAYAAAGMAVLGHAFPLFLGLKGGKCVATGLGVLLALFPAGAVCLMAYMLLMCVATRIVSLASISGYALYAAAMLILPGLAPDAIHPWFALALALFIIWRHRENLVRLVTGKEKPLDIPGAFTGKK